MATITASDDTNPFYKDSGPKDAQSVMFHHGWPLSSDDWDGQMLHFLSAGYRVIAHDWRGHGRSDQTDTGNEMDTYCTDEAATVTALELYNIVHISHSTGGGDVTRFASRAASGRVAKAILTGAVPSVMVRSARNPDGGLRWVSRGVVHEPGQVLQGHPKRSDLRFQSRRRAHQRGPDRQLLAPAHGRWRQGAVRLHPGVFRDRLHLRSASDHCSGAAFAW